MKRRSFLFICLAAALSIAKAKSPPVPLLVAEQLDSTGKSIGASAVTRRILAYITEKSGIEFDLQPYPWRRALMLAQEGQAAIWGLSKNEEREKIFIFSHPLYSTNVWMVVQKTRQDSITSIKDLAGKRVSVFQGESLNSEFEKARDEGLFMVEDDPNNLQIRFAKLLAGRCDVMLVNNRNLGIVDLTTHFIKFGFDPNLLHIIEHPLIVDPIHIGILKSKIDDFPMDALNKAIDIGRKAGEFDKT